MTKVHSQPRVQIEIYVAVWVQESLESPGCRDFTLYLLHAQCIFTHPNPFGQRGVWISEKFGHEWVGQAAQDGGFVFCWSRFERDRTGKLFEYTVDYFPFNVQ